MKHFDVIIVGAGPGGLYAALTLNEADKKVAIVEKGNPLLKRKCPINGTTVTSCLHCDTCAVMSGFGGAGAFSDGKYNITNDFGGTLHEHIGKEKALELMEEVDKINLKHSINSSKLFSTANSNLATLCAQNNMQLLSASVRHFGTDNNYELLTRLYIHLQYNGVSFFFNEEAVDVSYDELGRFTVITSRRQLTCDKCIISAGRSGSKWVESICKKLDIPTRANKVDIGVRVELPYNIFAHITDELYEGKIVYTTRKYEDQVRTFCMNPRGEVVTENSNGVVTVNGHSFEDKAKKTNNTNFALLVSMKLTEPFNDSNEYVTSIARLSNMLSGGIIVQRLGDLFAGRRTTQSRLANSTVTPTLNATPGDLSLVLPKRILDDIVEMLCALNKIAPGAASPSTLLYGVEIKSYNMEVMVDENLESKYKGLYFIGDGSGITHSLSHASASGVYVARHILS